MRKRGTGIGAKHGVTSLTPAHATAVLSYMSQLSGGTAELLLGCLRERREQEQCGC